MEPVKGRKGLILPDIAGFTRSILRVFDEIADRQSDIALDGGTPRPLGSAGGSSCSAAGQLLDPSRRYSVDQGFLN